MTTKVELVANIEGKYGATATLYRFEKGYHPKVARDTKKMLNWFFDDENVSPAVHIFSVIAGITIIVAVIPWVIATHGNVGAAAVAATIVALFVGWVAFLHTRWVRRITDKSANQLMLGLETDSSLNNGIDLEEDAERAKDAAKRVQQRHHDTLVDISDALAEVQRAGINNPDIKWKSRLAIQRLVNIEKRNNMSIQEMERAVASAKDKLSTTHLMLDYLEEAL